VDAIEFALDPYELPNADDPDGLSPSAPPRVPKLALFPIDREPFSLDTRSPNSRASRAFSTKDDDIVVFPGDPRANAAASAMVDRPTD